MEMNQTKNEPVKVIYSILKEQVESGMKKKELAEHYGLPVSNMTEILKECGLRIKPKRKAGKKYVIEGLEKIKEIDNVPEKLNGEEAPTQDFKEEIPVAKAEVKQAVTDEVQEVVANEQQKVNEVEETQEQKENKEDDIDDWGC